MDPAHPPDKASPDREAARSFVRTPFATRRNVVKLWRRLPAGLWSALDGAEDRRGAARAERMALAGVLLIALILALGFGSLAHRPPDAADGLLLPLLGRPMPAPGPEVGWRFHPGLSWRLVAWTVVPSLAGWLFVRAMWIPRVVRRRPDAGAALAFAQRLSGVYLFVYLMILAGAALMPVLVMLAPGSSSWLRWALWCFLFGESFFVPAVMWIRFVWFDRRGEVFGRGRFVVLGVYLVGCVVVPLLGMVCELDRLP